MKLSTMRLGTEEIARTAHEANRAYCISIGDLSQASWEEAPAWQKESCELGVVFLMENPDAPPSALHEAWLLTKINEGWIYGEVKDERERTHPCVLPYENLPQAQRSKDYIYGAVVKTLLKLKV